jgi:hypothetical protein
MKTETIRCDVCKLEVFFQEGREKHDFRPFFRIAGGIEVRNSTSYPFEDKHFCSPECLALAVEEYLVGKPIVADKIQAWAGENGYDLVRKQKATKPEIVD